MTPISLKLIYVQRGQALAGELRPVLSVRGLKDMLGLTLVDGVVSLIRRSHHIYDAALSVYNDAPPPLDKELDMLERVPVMTADASRLVGWLRDDGYAKEGVLDTSTFKSADV